MTFDDDLGARRSQLTHRIYQLVDLLPGNCRDERDTLRSMLERVSDGFQTEGDGEDIYQDVFKAVVTGIAYLDAMDREATELARTR